MKWSEFRLRKRSPKSTASDLLAGFVKCLCWMFFLCTVDADVTDLLMCVRCPMAYHMTDSCVSAGSLALTGKYIVCSRHFEPSKAHSLHTKTSSSWCFVCEKGLFSNRSSFSSSVVILKPFADEFQHHLSLLSSSRKLTPQHSSVCLGLCACNRLV